MVLARVLLDETDKHSRYPPQVPGLVDMVDLPLRRARSRPMSRWRTRLEVLRTTLLLPNPAQTIAPGARIHLERPELVYGRTLVVTFLPFVAHLAFDLPAGAKAVCVLDEAWVRFARSYERRRLRLASMLDVPSHWLRYRQIGRKADRVVTISPWERRYFERFIPTSRVDVVPHAIDLEYFRPDDTESRDIDVLIVGNHQPPLQRPAPLGRGRQRDQWPAGTRLKWALVGAPSREVQELASDRVLVPGRVEDVRPFYRRASSPSRPPGDVG